MKRFALLLALGLLAACATTPPQPVEGGPNWVGQQDFGAMLNARRAAAGRAPVSASDALQRAAAAHAADMVRQDYFAHVSPSGSNAGDRARAAGYRYCFLAENIARGQRDPAAALATWMNSPGHRANNLAREASEFGFAQAGDVYVLLLGRPGC